jgi:hypothetical protein
MSLSIAGVALLALVVLSQRWQQPGYAMPGIVLVVAGLCVGLTLAGCVLAACRQRPLLPWLTALTTLLFLAAFLTMFSIGPAVLLVAIATLVVRVRMGRHRESDRRSRVAAGLSVARAGVARIADREPPCRCLHARGQLQRIARLDVDGRGGFGRGRGERGERRVILRCRALERHHHDRRDDLHLQLRWR